MDFTHILKQAEDTIKQRGQIYCSYSKHVEIYSQIVNRIKNDLLQDKDVTKDTPIIDLSKQNTSMQNKTMLKTTQTKILRGLKLTMTPMKNKYKLLLKFLKQNL